MYKKLIDETNNVYERLQDEISRNIYKAHMIIAIYRRLRLQE